MFFMNSKFKIINKSCGADKLLRMYALKTAWIDETGTLHTEDGIEVAYNKYNIIG